MSFTAYALIRNFSSDVDELRFTQFRLRHIRQGFDQELLDHAERLFPTLRPTWDDWVYERHYESVPPPHIESGWPLGGIPVDTENLLMLLRLFRPGDIAFAAQAFERGKERLWQQPYRLLADVASSRRYELKQTECESFDAFVTELEPFFTAGADWFDVARRFFLYGGAKEFNRHFDEIDRIVDYTIALESILVFETEFISRRLRERAARLLGRRDDRGLVRLLRDFYRLRSTIVHGAPFSDTNRDLLDRMPEFEDTMRAVLIAAMRTIPPDQEERCTVLKSLYEISDAVRAEKVDQDLRSLPRTMRDEICKKC